MLPPPLVIVGIAGQHDVVGSTDVRQFDEIPLSYVLNSRVVIKNTQSKLRHKYCLLSKWAVMRLESLTKMSDIF